MTVLKLDNDYADIRLTRTRHPAQLLSTANRVSVQDWTFCATPMLKPRTRRMPPWPSAFISSGQAEYRRSSSRTLRDGC